MTNNRRNFIKLASTTDISMNRPVSTVIRGGGELVAFHAKEEDLDATFFVFCIYII